MNHPVHTVCLSIDVVKAASLLRCLLVYRLNFTLKGKIGDLGKAVRRLNTLVVDQISLQRFASLEKSVHASFGFLLHLAVEQHVAVHMLFQANVAKKISTRSIGFDSKTSRAIPRKKVIIAQPLA